MKMKLRIWDKLRSNVIPDDDYDADEKKKSYSWMIWWNDQKLMVNSNILLKWLEK